MSALLRNLQRVEQENQELTRKLEQERTNVMELRVLQDQYGAEREVRVLVSLASSCSRGAGAAGGAQRGDV